jgi:geranylgeranyl diphosphate synthase type I
MNDANAGQNTLTGRRSDEGRLPGRQGHGPGDGVAGNRHLEQDRALVENRLDALLRDLSYPDPPKVSSAPLMDDVAAQARISDHGGKRLRALLLLACWRVAAGRAGTPAAREEAVRDLACSIEIFQTGALVHDDIMDDADERRGRPSAHRALADAVRRFGPDELDRKAWQQSGIGLGIMLGDLFATVSLRVAVRALRGDGTENLLDPVLSRLLTMQQDVEIGQVLDEADSLIRLDDPDSLVRNCEAVYLRKTASYTSVAPIAIGLICAGMDPAQADDWSRRIGEPLGLGFQISDDLKDVVPSAVPTGKPLYGDLREGKRTMLFADALRLLDGDDRDRLIRLYRRPARDEKDVGTIRRLLVGSGAVDASFRRLDDLRGRVGRESSLLLNRLGRPDATELPALLDEFFVRGTATRLD